MQLALVWHWYLPLRIYINCFSPFVLSGINKLEQHQRFLAICAFLTGAERLMELNPQRLCWMFVHVPFVLCFCRG